MPARIADLRPHYPLLLSVAVAVLTGLIALQQLAKATSQADTVSSKLAQCVAEQQDARKVLSLRQPGIDGYRRSGTLNVSERLLR